ncbi:DUF523 domain-containing protein [Gymnodinialimonas sp. 2305UL16-5]|uniref:DUF523 domain-containing protein n=1 Tax=Gymnodinialimonas mytili TaxID=3126503 RepID=UPI0030A26B0D
MERIFVSSCLLGALVRYDGGAKTLDSHLLEKWRAEGRLVPLCPEVTAGLPTPRPAAELEPGARADEVLTGQGRIYDKDGHDMTAAFVRGADLALQTAQKAQCRFALLTDGSPSCGSSYVYRGHFDGTRQPGEGVVAARLRRAGVAVFGQDQIGDLARALDIAENTPV